MAKSQDKGEAFELRVKALLEGHGFQVERDVLIAGNQVDLVARRSVGPVPQVCAVECKAYAKPVGIEDVAIFNGRFAAARREDPRVCGLFVSENGFTKEAKASATAAGVTCITVEELEQGLPLEVDLEPAIARYNQHVVDRYGRLTLYSLKADAPLQVELEKVYVQLTIEPPAVEREWRIFGGLLGPRIIIGGTTEHSASQETHEERKREHSLPLVFGSILSVAETLAQTKRIIVIGTPGSGKTTLLQWIALTFAHDLAGERLGLEEHRVPIVVPLRVFGKYVEDHPDRFEPTPACLLDFLEKHFAGWRLDLPPGFFARLAEEGGCAFLFDGLDEVADPGRRADVTRAVETFVARYGGNRFAVTSRPAGYTGLARLGTDFTRYDVRPFSDEDVAQFVTNWYLAVETAAEDNPTTRQKAAENSDDLLQRIRENDRIRRLVDNPLLLTVVALVHQNRITLSQWQAELYDECTQMLLGFWDEQKGGEAARELAQLGELDRYEKRAILEPIALRLHEQREAREVEGEVLREWLREEFAAIGDLQPQRRAALFLKVIQERAGLLVESDAVAYRFSHLIFQEYLAARAVADREDYVAYTVERRHDPWWREVVLLEVGHLSTPRSKRARRLTTDLVRAIWQAEEEDPLEREVERLLRRNVLLAGCCLAELGPTGIDGTARDRIVAELGEILRTTPYSKLLEEAAQALAGLGGSSSTAQATTELILTLTGTKNGQVRRVATNNLIQLGQANSEVIQILTTALTNTDLDIRGAAASSLVQLDQSGPEVIQALTTALSNAAPDVRQAAASSLVQLDQVSSQVIQTLITALANAQPEVRQAATTSLIQLGKTDPDAVQALIGALTDKDPQIRWGAAVSLGQLRQANPDMVQALITVLSDTDWPVRQAAAASLGQLSQVSSDIVQALITALSDTDSWRGRRGAACGLAQIDQAGPKVIQALMDALPDIDWPVRQAAAASLGQLGYPSPEVIQTLINALADTDWPVRQTAAATLGQLGQAEPKAIQALIDALSDSDSPVQEAAASSLGQLRQDRQEVVYALTTTLASTNSWRVRQVAASSLIQLGQASPDVVQTLACALSDADSQRVRQAAASSLIQLGQTNPEAMRGFTATPTDANSYIRDVAVNKLFQFNQVNSSVVQALTQALTDTDPDTRRKAVYSLIQLSATNRKTVLRALLPTFTDPAFEKPDLLGRPAYDHAFDALWAIAGPSERES